MSPKDFRELHEGNFDADIARDVALVRAAEKWGGRHLDDREVKLLLKRVRWIFE